MCGYLFKSPPLRDQKKKEPIFHGLACTGGTPKFFKKRWRERYCVLYKVRSRDKTEIFFEYYKDSHCTKLKGQVDLKNCDCIIDDDNSGEKWPNVFSVQTIHNGQRRVYYFSAPSVQNMSDWVRHLVDVTGFVVTVQSDFPSFISGQPHGTHSGWGSHRMKPPSVMSCPNPFSTISGSVKSGWLAETAARSVQVSRSDWDEDGYREPGLAGLEYLLSGPEDEQDTYYKVPGLSHSYVNLSTTACGDESAPQRLHHSRSQSSAAATNTSARVDPAHNHLCKPLPHPSKPLLGAIDGSNTNSESKISPNMHDHCSGTSDSSLYFNVWESGNGDGVSCTPDSVLAIATSTVPVTRSQVNGKQRTVPGPNIRIYRRSKVMSVYHQLPMALPPDFTPNPMVDSAPLPARKMVASSTSDPCQNIASAAQPTLPVLVNHKEASIALELSPMDVDLALPTRVPGSHSLDDSSLGSPSVSSKSLSDTGVVIDRPHLDICDSNGCPLSLPPASLEKKAPEGTSTKKELPSGVTGESTPAGSSRSEPSLNYIEQCNLDLSAVPSIAHSRSSVPASRLNADVPPYKQPVDTGMSCINLDIRSNRTPSADEYKTEYREIDPIGTSALAVVTKRYLDADLTA